jgi:hypothetical protein
MSLVIAANVLFLATLALSGIYWLVSRRPSQDLSATEKELLDAYTRGFEDGAQRWTITGGRFHKTLTNS